MAREAIGMVIRLAGVVLVVRLIGPSSYGLYAAAAAFSLFVVSFAQLGVEVFLIKVPGELDPKRYDQAFTLLVVTSLAVTLIAEGLTYLCGGLLRPVGVVEPLRVLLLSIPINVLWAPAQARIERNFRYRAMGLIELGGDIVLYAVAVPMALDHTGPWALVTGFFACQAWLLAASLAVSGLAPRWDWSPADLKVMLKAGLSYSTSQWTTYLVTLVNPLVVGTFLGATGVGYVAFAQRLVGTIGFAQRSVWRLGMAALSRVPSRDLARLRYAIEEGSMLQMLALAIPFAAFGVLARWLVPVIFGAVWAPAVPLYSVLALSVIVGTPAFVQSTFLYTRGANMAVARANTLKGAVLGFAAFVLVPIMGIDGYGVAALIALVSVLYTDALVRSFLAFGYRKLLPWALVLCPPVLFPLLGMPAALVLLAPVTLALAPPMRRELTRVFALVRSAITASAPSAAIDGARA